MSEGRAMFNVLQARGVPSKLLMYPDENHVSAISFFRPDDFDQERRKRALADP